MAVSMKRIAAVVCLMLVSGCVTDELVVYMEGVVSGEAMKPFLGTYRVEEWPGDMTPESVRVATKKDGELSMSYSLPDRIVHVQFILSKIPNSKKDLYLLSLPSQQETKQKNLFFVGQAGAEQTHIWAVFSNLPIAKDHLTFKNGKAKAQDVKTFLAKNADAFVAANDPQVTLKSPMR